MIDNIIIKERTYINSLGAKTWFEKYSGDDLIEQNIYYFDENNSRICDSIVEVNRDGREDRINKFYHYCPDGLIKTIYDVRQSNIQPHDYSTIFPRGYISFYINHEYDEFKNLRKKIISSDSRVHLFFEYSYDRLNRIIEERFLEPDRYPSEKFNVKKISFTKYRSDGSYESTEKNPSLNELFSQKGNYSEPYNINSKYTPEGKILYKGTMIWSESYKYDQHGHIIEEVSTNFSESTRFIKTYENTYDESKRIKHVNVYNQEVVTGIQEYFYED